MTNPSLSHVLILDDEPSYSRSIARALQTPHQFEVETASTPEEALKKAEDAAKQGIPFEVFLIDQRLGSEKTGIEVMQDLKRISPSAEGVIFTGFDTTDEDGVRALQAGAFRYLIKPVPREELIYVLDAIRESRWQKIFGQMLEDTLKKQSFQAVAQVVVASALRLGFRRAHLFWVPHALDAEKGPNLVGITCGGVGCIENFRDRLFHEKSWPMLHDARLERKVTFVHPAIDATRLEQARASGYEPPASEWVILPIWSDKSLGLLMLDYGPDSRELTDFERKSLPFFARQVSAVLERARIFEKEKRAHKETDTISKIGQQITAHASKGDLKSLLEQVRKQVQSLINVDNFKVILTDEDVGEMILPLYYRNGEREELERRPLHTGLEGHLLDQEKEIFISHGVAEYCHKHGIQIEGPLPLCWIGVPLMVEDKIIGGLIVKNYEREYAFWTRDKSLLKAVAHQIAGAIQISKLSEEDRAETQRLQLLQQASAEMLRIGHENTDKMWLTALTIATANFGTGFNRALLFRFNYNRTQLVGRTAVGTDDSELAHAEWEKDETRGYSFEHFLNDLRNGNLNHTDFEYAIKKVIFPLEGAGAIQDCINKNEQVFVLEGEIEARLPREITQTFELSDCCILPLRAGEKILGVVLVDNKHNRRPLKDKSLNRLQTLLNNVGLSWETLHQQEKSDLLLMANYAILGESSQKPLKETLQHICDSAQVIAEADWAIIYPLKPGATLYEFDVPNISYKGELQHPLEEVVKEKPRQKGVSTHILLSGPLVVGDISTVSVVMPSRQKLSEHHFIRREGVKAMIGMPIRDAITSESLGVFYLDYRSVRTFSDEDINNAKSFASLAGIAIANMRRQERERADAAKLRQREREISHRMLEQALGSDNEKDVLRALVTNIREAVHLSQDSLSIVLRDWEPQGKHGAPKEVHKAYRATSAGELVEEIEPSNCLVQSLKGKNLLIGPDHLTACVPIRIADRMIGAIHAQSVLPISPEQADILQRMAPVAALAMDNIRRQDHLRSVLHSAQTVSAAMTREETLRRVAETVRQVSPEISAFIIWYRDAETREMKIGGSYGLYQGRKKKQDSIEQSHIVQMVAQRHEPIWAANVKQYPALLGRFVQDERIVSVAAFPLHTGDDPVGAMFFNYRSPHHFTTEEQTIFTILAQIVASNIRDSIRLEEAEKQHERLQATLQVAEAVSATLNLEDTFKRVLSKLREMFDDTTFCIMTYDEDEETLNFAPATLEFYKVENPEYQAMFSFSMDEKSIACRVARRALEQKDTVIENVEDVNDDPSYLPLIFSTRSELCVSLMSGENLLGVLVLERTRLHGFTKDDEMLIENVAHQVSMAIDRAKQNEQLEFKSTVAAAYTWASDIAHDINREVGAIKMVSYLLQKTTPSREKIIEYGQKIGRSAQILSDAGSGPWSDQSAIEVELDNFLRDNLLNLAQPLNMEIEFDLDASHVKLRTNPFAFQRILRHLTRNAAQAMQTVTEKKIILRTRVPEDDKVEIQFQDCGPGVREDVQLSMFHHKVTTKGRTGGGFGLLNVRQMIEDMGGKIRLLPTTPGQGALFSIRLPISGANDKE
jgi:GAF domain-containing protein/DNA-binding response OmpR family regulator